MACTEKGLVLLVVVGFTTQRDKCAPCHPLASCCKSQARCLLQSPMLPPDLATSCNTLLIGCCFHTGYGAAMRIMQPPTEKAISEHYELEQQTLTC